MKQFRRNLLKSYFIIAALAFLAVFVFLTPASATTIYTTELSFTNDLNTGYYLEQFIGYSPGNPLGGNPITDQDYGPTNNYKWHAYSSDYLYSMLNALSTENNDSVIKITFLTGTGLLPVTAVGGYFSATNKDGSVNNAWNVKATLNDASNLTVTGYGFVGFTSTSPFTSLEISTQFTGSGGGWPTIEDKFYVGGYDAPVPAAVPEPTTMLLLGAGLLGVAGTVRRRKII